MKTYIFTVEDKSRQRGYNRTIRVYRVKNNVPVFVGKDDKIDTASYKGDHATAHNIVSDNDGHKLDVSGYTLISDNIRVLEIA